VNAQTHRRVLLLPHADREISSAIAVEMAAGLSAAGVEPLMLPEDLAAAVTGVSSPLRPADPVSPLDGVELVAVLGGDGTILRAAELARGTGVPLLGVNLGKVGFLAEAERDHAADTVRRIADQDYEVEERMTIDVDVLVDGVLVNRTWAVNEASVEKASRERMVEVVLEVDGRPVSEFGCDGVVLATPTGSTAYAFSAGGPVVWPEVEALLLVPISAHALFARPLVVAPTSVPAVEVLSGEDAVLWCDGRRSFPLVTGSRVEVRRSDLPVRLARLARQPFTDRLVAKFGLPVRGWRGARRAPHDRGAHEGALPTGPGENAHDLRDSR
jgi:NAD+ kinase